MIYLIKFEVKAPRLYLSQKQSFGNALQEAKLRQLAQESKVSARGLCVRSAMTSVQMCNKSSDLQ